jgi:hypothetical protein
VTRLFSIILAIAFAVSLSSGAVAHAMEPIACSDAEANEHLSSADQPLDESGDADGEKSSAHLHGGCHGHHVAQPSPDTSDRLTSQRAALPTEARATRLKSAAVMQGLRPPIF